MGGDASPGGAAGVGDGSFGEITAADVLLGPQALRRTAHRAPRTARAAPASEGRLAVGHAHAARGAQELEESVAVDAPADARADTPAGAPVGHSPDVISRTASDRSSQVDSLLPSHRSFLTPPDFS